MNDLKSLGFREWEQCRDTKYSDLVETFLEEFGERARPTVGVLESLVKFLAYRQFQAQQDMLSDLTSDPDFQRGKIEGLQDAEALIQNLITGLRSKADGRG